MQQKLYDNFVKRGYTGSDIDCTTNSKGINLRQAVTAAVYSNRKDPNAHKFGAKQYAELRKDFPRASSVEMPPCNEDLVCRPLIARYVKNCSQSAMRSRPELVAFLKSLSTPLNGKEMNEVCDIFLRCNARNTHQLPDLLGLCRFFGETDMRSNWPAHHSLIRVQIDAVLAQVLSLLFSGWGGVWDPLGPRGPPTRALGAHWGSRSSRSNSSSSSRR